VKEHSTQRRRLGRTQNCCRVWWRKPIRESSEALKEQGANFHEKMPLWEDLAEDPGLSVMVQPGNRMLRRPSTSRSHLASYQCSLFANSLHYIVILLPAVANQFALNCRLPAPGAPNMADRLVSLLSGLFNPSLMYFHGRSQFESSCNHICKFRTEKWWKVVRIVTGRNGRAPQEALLVASLASQSSPYASFLSPIQSC
jgi:hypothetical protein